MRIGLTETRGFFVNEDLYGEIQYNMKNAASGGDAIYKMMAAKTRDRDKNPAKNSAPDKTRNHPKPTETTQNPPKPYETYQNLPKPYETRPK